MYTRILIPLDGSKVAEQVLPYARGLARALGIPVELLSVIDIEPLAQFVDPDHRRYLDTLLGEKAESNQTYLEGTARSFQAVSVKCSVERGKPEDVIIEKAATEKGTLIAMATHGRSGIQRWLLGSVADKVIHGSTNHVFLIRAVEQGRTEGEAGLKKAIVPLDGSPLAEKVLLHVVDLAKKMSLEVIFLRAYALPPTMGPDEYGAYSEELINYLEAEAKDYLATKIVEVEKQSVKNVSPVVELGYGAEQITALARKTPDNFIAMSTHGRSGVTRWVMGSVTERVVRYSGDPVLIVRASDESVGRSS
jgi:nucleotide-binding universal stress UspA family protein